MIADLSADAHRRFFVGEDGREMFERRLDQQSISRKEVTDGIIAANQALYDDWKAKAGMVSVERDAIEDMNKRIRSLEKALAKAETRAKSAEDEIERMKLNATTKRGPGRPKKDDAE